MELQWQASLSASSLHAAAAMIAGEELADRKMAAAIAGPVETLRSVVADLKVDTHAFVETLIEQASRIENNRQLATRALQKTVGAGNTLEVHISAVAGAVAEVEGAVLRTVPDLVDQLAVRGEPLRQHWEARGPGLLTIFGRLTEHELIAPRAEVVLVFPALGGGGAAHLATNSVRIEAVLANAHPRLPEVLRLGWLLSQLQMEIPMFGESISRDRLPYIVNLAALPPVLAAGSEVELASFDKASVEQALVAWHVEKDRPQVLAEILMSWWDTYFSASPRWAVALGALNEMVA